MMDLIIRMEKSELGPKIACWEIVDIILYFVITS